MDGKIEFMSSVKNSEACMTISNNGKVTWVKDGVTKECEDFKELAQVFNWYICEVQGLDVQRIRDEIFIEEAKKRGLITQ
mgnify:CR=1 FL=1